jgi:hypothetical protein
MIQQRTRLSFSVTLLRAVFAAGIIPAITTAAVSTYPHPGIALVTILGYLGATAYLVLLESVNYRMS